MPKGHFERTAEHRRKIGEAQKKAWEKRRANLPANWGKWNTGRIVTPEQRAAISERNSGPKSFWYGKKLPPETIAKMKRPRNNLRRYGITDELRDEMRAKGFRWCSNHKGFVPADGFYTNAKTQCIACNLSPENYQLRKKLREYGVDLDWYQAKMLEQDGKCAICKQAPPENGKKGRLCVDHDHAKNSARALLCDNCNKGLGCFKDNVSFLQNAIAYLETRLIIM